MLLMHFAPDDKQQGRQRPNNNTNKIRNKIMTKQQRIEQYQIDVSDLAEKFLDRAVNGGAQFSEGLCNWAISKAEQTIEKPE